MLRSGKRAPFSGMSVFKADANPPVPWSAGASPKVTQDSAAIPRV